MIFGLGNRCHHVLRRGFPHFAGNYSMTLRKRQTAVALHPARKGQG
ncbi:hypothetical protein [Devosia sp. DBB001]|nr:hypothetical protein [Devosia sp. DBB001]